MIFKISVILAGGVMLSHNTICCAGVMALLLCIPFGTLIYHGCSMYEDGVSSLSTNQDFVLANDRENRFNVTYTSFENTTPSKLRNESYAIGNEFVVTTIVDDVAGIPELDVENITTRLECEPQEIIFVETKVGNRSTFAIPWRSHNITGNLFLEAVTFNGTEYCLGFYNLSFMNTFAPIITHIETDPPNLPSREGAILNVSWTIVDGNIGESHLSDFMFSDDDGETFQIIAFNITDDFYNGWQIFPGLDEYAIRVDVRDSKGLVGQRIRYDGWESTSLPRPVISISSPPDIEMVSGTTGNEIQWILQSPFDGEYNITVSGILFTSGIWRSHEGPIIFSLDGLLPAVYEVTLNIKLSSEYSFTDSVKVTVYWGIANIVMLSSGIGVAIGFVVVSSLWFLRRRNP
ncbi:MAG: hypothetical protein ACXACE_00100 [Candidatus Thorarchaeota archaeon]